MDEETGEPRDRAPGLRDKRAPASYRDGPGDQGDDPGTGGLGSHGLRSIIDECSGAGPKGLIPDRPPDTDAVDDEGGVGHAGKGPAGKDGDDSLPPVHGSFFLMPMEALPLMHRELEEYLGRFRAEEILFRYGFRCGENVVKNLQPDKVGLDQLFNHMKELWCIIGLSSMVIRKVDWKGLTIEVDGSGEGGSLGERDRPSCHFTGGYLTGIASALSGEPFRFREVSCVSRGDARCVFKLVEDIEGIDEV